MPSGLCYITSVAGTPNTPGDTLAPAPPQPASRGFFLFFAFLSPPCYAPKIMEIKIIRSEKRAKTVSGKVVDNTFVVRAPANIPETELEPIIQKLLTRIERREKKKTLNDADLARKAHDLNQRYFQGKLQWQSLKWVTNQNQRYGSCTPSRGTIRISHRLATMPAFVLDYVIMHELAHLKEANHGPRFWKLVNRFPKTERARGYLMAVGLEDLEV